MESNHNLGQAGEQLAADWLAARGYSILHRNWRSGRYEIDIIASKGTVLHILEIKSRRDHKFGFPEESVGKQKIRSLMNAGKAFLFQHREWKRVQYDILSITIRSPLPDEYFLIQDVYV